MKQEHKDILLHGSPDVIPNSWSNKKFEGVINQLQRRYKETDSDGVRVEIEKYMIEQICPTCVGKRLKPELLSVKFAGKNIDDVTSIPISDAYDWFHEIKQSVEKKTSKLLSENQQMISLPVLKELEKRLSFLTSVGVEYLSLGRRSKTLSGGESQRINLATQIGSGLSGVLYILDEPSIGLHQRDQDRLVKTLKNLRDLGNTVIVVEHDRDTIEAADYIVDIGPGGGKQGGKSCVWRNPKANYQNKNHQQARIWQSLSLRWSKLRKSAQHTSKQLS